ncbi:MAG: hypothetical protein IPF98_14895 [Gemmatimonadetes bacterium]|nr:hypothetical protein [Gemmatimonadota bacterium]MCC6770352.1 hypothetical protein [Gemmatimonadaceae bacterium]
MKAMVSYAAASAVLLALLGAVLAVVYTAGVERRAIVLSALVAFTTQLVAFAIVRLTAEKNLIAGWGLGAILRFLVFGVWALVLVKPFGLPSAVAMISLAVFLFASTLVEPLFLKS